MSRGLGDLYKRQLLYVFSKGEDDNMSITATELLLLLHFNYVNHLMKQHFVNILENEKDKEYQVMSTIDYKSIT